MNRKQIPSLILGLLLLTTGCLNLPNPAVEISPTPTATPTEAILTFTPTPTRTPPPPTATTTHLPDPTSSPTATLFPEQQLHTITDQTGAIEANLPTTWTDLRSEPWLDENGQTLGTTFLVATDIEAFIEFRAEGVAISVSRRLPVGYIQLLDAEYDKYIQSCQDTYRTRWTLDYSDYIGKYFVFGECAGLEYTWLSLLAVTSKQDPGQYVARVVGLDLIPIYGETFREIILGFKVYPEKLP